MAGCGQSVYRMGTDADPSVPSLGRVACAYCSPEFWVCQRRGQKLDSSWWKVLVDTILRGRERGILPDSGLQFSLGLNAPGVGRRFLGKGPKGVVLALELPWKREQSLGHTQEPRPLG